MNRREIYKPIAQRSLENYQVSYLANKYDFSKQSLITRILVDEVNKKMQEAEAIIGIKRVKPFCLFIKKNSTEAILPLFRASYLKPIHNGENFRHAKQEVIRACTKIYRKSFKGSGSDDVTALINPWSKVYRRRQGFYREMLRNNFNSCNEKDSADINKMISSINPVSPAARMHVVDISAPGRVIEKLTDFVRAEIGFGKAVAKQMVEDLITLRNIACPRTVELRSGEMPMLVTHVSARLSLETDTRFRKLAPVIITVLSPEELETGQYTTSTYLEILKKRIARVAFEAYRQNGLLSLAEMQWIFLLDSTSLARIAKSFQIEHNIIIPTPGTILDAGRAMTHKDIIVRLHLKGHNVLEIARITYHSPRSIDSYIGTFEAVLILYLYSMTPELMSRILVRSISLIREYLKLICDFYTSTAEIKRYLFEKGVIF